MYKQIGTIILSCILCMVLLWCCAVGADKTKYNFLIPGNAYAGASNYTIKWLAEHYDGVVAYGDHPLLGEQIYDTIHNWPVEEQKVFKFGQYASTQELPLLGAALSTGYAARLIYIGNWLVPYSEHYMDSIGVSIESLYVHLNDNFVTITQQVGGCRAIISGSDYHYVYTFALSDSALFIWHANGGNTDTVTHLNVTTFDTTIVSTRWTNNTTYYLNLRCKYNSDKKWYTIGAQEVIVRSGGIQSLPIKQRRFCYQNWRNDVTEPDVYPSGYQWLANGWNADARRAIAYAFRRHYLEDSASYGDGRHHYTCYFADNQYRYGAAPRLNSYYSINATSGGPSSQMDWIEQSEMENNATNLLRYYDQSTMLIDSVIDLVMDSTCDARSIERVTRFANVDKVSTANLAVQLDYTSVEFELCYEYPGASWSIWNTKMNNAALISSHPSRKASFEFRLDVFWNPAMWYTKSRVTYAAMAWFLTMQDTSMYMVPVRWTDTTVWNTGVNKSIFEIDIGDPIPGTIVAGDITGSGSTERRVIRRKYIHDGDTNIVLFRTGYSSDPGTLTDPLSVSLGNNYYYISVGLDTTKTTVSTVSLLPMQAWIGTQSLGGDPAPVIGNVLPVASYYNSSDSIKATISDNTGVNHAYCSLRNPAGDSIFIADSVLSPISASFNFSHYYTFSGDTGVYKIIFGASDGAGNFIRDTTLINVYEIAIRNMAPVTDYRDSVGDISVVIIGGLLDYRVDSVYCYLWLPGTEHEINDSVFVKAMYLNPAQTRIDFAGTYTWPIIGTYQLVFVAWDKIKPNPDVGRDSISVLITQPGNTPPGKKGRKGKAGNVHGEILERKQYCYAEAEYAIE